MRDARARCHLVNGHIELRPECVLPTIDPSPSVSARIDRWAMDLERELDGRCRDSQIAAAKGGQGKVKQNFVNAGHLRQKVLSALVEHDLIQLHCGLLVPFDDASLDRLKAADDYRDDMTELTTVALNLLRKACCDDHTPVWEWILRLNPE